jgi:alanyl aminopeptidase
MALVLDDAFDVRESRRILWSAGATPEGREQLWRFVRDQWEALLDRLPEQSRASIPYYGSGFCSLDKARELEAFFRPRIDGLEGAPRNLAQAVESVELCAAYAQEQQPAVERFLRAYPPNHSTSSSTGSGRLNK